MIDIKEIRELCDKATPGPWKSGRYIAECSENGLKIHNVEEQEKDEFIAKSREVIPALLDELEAAQAEIERLRALNTAANDMLALEHSRGFHDAIREIQQRMSETKGDSHE